MARIGLKLFYLRTRVRKISQQELADTIGVRQATLSNIERGTSLPTCPLLLELSRFFDVTPTFLLDDERGVRPHASERWSQRDALVTTGMWVEVPIDQIVKLDANKAVCPLLPSESFYDDEAKQRRQDEAARVAKRAVAKLRQERTRDDLALAEALEGELAKHPQRRRRS